MALGLQSSHVSSEQLVKRLRHQFETFGARANLKAEQGVKMAKKLIRDNTALVADQVYIHPKYREL